MGSTRARTVGLAAFALLSTGLFALPVLAQQGGQHSQREGVANSKAGLQGMPLNNLSGGGRSSAAKPGGEAAAPAADTPAASAPAPSAGGSGSSNNAPVSAPAAPPAAPAVSAVPLAPSLSQDAPEVPPSLGVVGARGASSGPSPAATPEPSTLLLMGTGLVGLYRLRKRQ